MKVILLQDVAKIGRRFEIVEVPNGYAQNKLIPQKLATEATPENVTRVKARASKLAASSAADAEALAGAIASLGDTTVTVTAEANAEGHLFAALKSDRIADAFAAAGAAIAADAITIMTPIKTTGTHTIEVGRGEAMKEVTIEVVAA
jgi:large subunit ribosomal protein L9